jgi:thiol-disulfide isomerase/thioredoxin
MKTKKSKEIITIVLIVLTGVYFTMNTDTDKVTIMGKINNTKGESVTFSNQDTSYVTTTQANGTFMISFSLDSATYLNFQHGPEATAMYVYPGDKINLTIDTELFDETIKYNGSPTSSFLAKKYLLNEVTNLYGEVYYISSTEEYQTYLENYKTSVINEFNRITDSTFINSEISNIDKDIAYFIGRQKKMTEYSDDARNYMWETREISRDFNFYAALDSLNSVEFNEMAEQYTAVFESALNKVTDEEFLATEKAKIKKTTTAWKERKNSVEKMPKQGDPAIDFKYSDIDGNEFSLSSFNGKLIYVDVWATWCGPCVAEIPYLQKLESDYHAKNITFMSISVDEDKEDWKKMVTEKELSGIQLWADGWSKITKDYAIFGIPRFMLFDKEGNVISTNAPRPSSDNIRRLLDTNLQ